MLNGTGDNSGARCCSRAFAAFFSRRRRNETDLGLERSIDPRDQTTGESQLESEGVPQGKHLLPHPESGSGLGSLDRPEFREKVVAASGGGGAPEQEQDGHVVRPVDPDDGGVQGPPLAVGGLSDDTGDGGARGADSTLGRRRVGGVGWGGREG